MTALEILYHRFRGRSWAGSFAITMPEHLRGSLLHQRADELGVKAFFYDENSILEKPLSLRQQRWGLEDDTGCETLVGAPLSAAAEQMKWTEFVLIPCENLLVEPNAVSESLTLFYREGLEICFSAERQTGANWIVFKTEVVKALMLNHEDIMWARGGLAWAIRKPLYPFNQGNYHCPRIRPRISCDLRLNSKRNRQMYDRVFTQDFASPDFSYENWLSESAWEKYYLEPGPSQINVEPSALCQAQCFACPKNELKRKGGLMPFATFKQLFEGLNEPEECRFVFSGIGEPLLNPALTDMISYSARSSSMLITSLQRNFPDNFSFSGLDQIRLSVDALESKGFEQKRPGCSWKNIESFISFASSRKCENPDEFPEVGVSLVKHGLNAKDALAFINYWKKVTTPVFNEWFFRWPFDTASDKIAWFQILGENSFLNKLNKTSEIDFTPVRRRPCRHALLSVNIFWDGRVSFCPFDVDATAVIGNVNETSLGEIWNSDHARELRDTHLNLREEKMPEICARCQDWYHGI
jgi:radical SAM protein with 4Fe4S-binding SPASM domain